MLARRIAELLQWNRAIDATRIVPGAEEGGIVTLDGVVPTYAHKCAAEEIARGVRGVTTVRNQLEVRLTIGDYRTDATLERVLRDLIDCLARMPAELPRVTVVDGWVTLDGVASAFQKQLVERVVREVAGVRGITNRITIETPRGGRLQRERAANRWPAAH